MGKKQSQTKKPSRTAAWQQGRSGITLKMWIEKLLLLSSLEPLNYHSGTTSKSQFSDGDKLAIHLRLRKKKKKEKYRAKTSLHGLWRKLHLKTQKKTLFEVSLKLEIINKSCRILDVMWFHKNLRCVFLSNYNNNCFLITTSHLKTNSRRHVKPPKQ